MAELDLSESCLVVAHPDDEVLWFSSILERVGQIVMCFEDCAEYPALGPQRRAVLAEYPRAGVRSLGLAEPCSVHLVDWAQPKADDVGLQLNAPGATAERVAHYRETFTTLRAQLSERLRGVPAVFTHNPWGEYGHADHVQLARVVESLRLELGYRVFHSGYIAHRTLPLAAAHLERLGAPLELPIQRELAPRLQALYRRHGCWTWPDDYQRFETETFLESGVPALAPGIGFRLNCVMP